MDVVGWSSFVQYHHWWLGGFKITVGVVLLCEELGRLEVRMADEEQMVKIIKHFEGVDDFDVDRFRQMCEIFSDGICNREINSLPTFKRFIETRANRIQMTGPCGVRITDFDEQLAEWHKYILGG